MSIAANLIRPVVICGALVPSLAPRSLRQTNELILLSTAPFDSL